MKSTTLHLVIVLGLFLCRDSAADEVSPPRDPQESEQPSKWDLTFIAGTGKLAESIPETSRNQFKEFICSPDDLSFRYVSLGATISVPRGIAFVKVERQEFDSDTNKWGKVITLPRMPFTVDFRDESAPRTELDLNLFRARVELQKERVAKPSFPPMADDALWLPPVPMSDANGVKAALVQEQEALAVHQKIENCTTRIEAMERGMLQMAIEYDRIDNQRPGSRIRGDTILLHAMALWAFNDGKNVAQAQKRSEVQKRAADQIKDRFIKMSNKKDEEQAARSELYDVFFKYPEELQVRILKGKNVARSQISAWSHDLSCKPGLTYRYRMTPVILNPNLKFSSSAEANQGNQASLFVELAPSEWTSSIRVDK